MNKTAKLIINMTGGVFQGASINVNDVQLDIVVVDYDTSNYDDEDCVSVPQASGYESSAGVWVCGGMRVEPEWVEKAFKSIMDQLDASDEDM